MTKEQFSRAKQLQSEEQLLDNVFNAVYEDTDFRRLPEMYRKSIYEALTQIKATIRIKFEKL